MIAKAIHPQVIDHTSIHLLQATFSFYSTQRKGLIDQAWYDASDASLRYIWQYYQYGDESIVVEDGFVSASLQEYALCGMSFGMAVLRKLWQEKRTFSWARWLKECWSLHKSIGICDRWMVVPKIKCSDKIFINAFAPNHLVNGSTVTPVVNAHVDMMGRRYSLM